MSSARGYFFLKVLNYIPELALKFSLKLKKIVASFLTSITEGWGHHFYFEFENFPKSG